MPTQVRVALAMRIRIDSDIAGFAIRSSLESTTERHFGFRVTPGRTYIKQGRKSGHAVLFLPH